MNASFWGLIALLAALAAAPFAARRWGARRVAQATQSGAADLRLVANLALGPQHRVVAIDAQRGAGKCCLVLGIAHGQVSLLHRFDEPLATRTPVAPATPATPGLQAGVPPAAWREAARQAGLAS